jgi:hypothetical protein
VLGGSLIHRGFSYGQKMSLPSVENNMEEEGTVRSSFTFKKRNIRKQASRKRKGSEEEDRT